MQTIDIKIERERINPYSNKEVNKTTIRISGLHETTKDEVRDLFEFHGKIQEEYGVTTNHNGTYFFVKYVHEESAQKAINARNGKSFGYAIITVELAETR